MPFTEIEVLAEQYATAAHAAADLLHEAEAEIAQVRDRYLPRLRVRAANVADARSRLVTAIQAEPNLWEKPRTRVFHGVKVGLQKQPGALKWEDDSRVAAKIKQFYVDEIGVLIKTTEKPVKEALEKLPANELKRLGITVVDAGDVVVAKVVTGDVEKLLRALAGSLEQDTEVAA